MNGEEYQFEELACGYDIEFLSECLFMIEDAIESISLWGNVDYVVGGS
jgi:hypothetical protein